MANLKSEQLDINMKVVIDQDDVVQGFDQYLALFKKHLGTNNVNVEVVCNKKVISFLNQSSSNKKIILLFKAITYLGGNGQHPLFKKRIQLPGSWKKFVTSITQKNPYYDVRFLGIYKYKKTLSMSILIKQNTWIKLCIILQHMCMSMICLLECVTVFFQKLINSIIWLP